MNEKVKKYRLDIIVISVILLVALIYLGFVLIFRRDGASVTVTVNNVEIGTYPLNKNATYELRGKTSTAENPVTNILVIEDGVAYLTYANCPDETCVARGKIKYVGESLTCLPNEITIKVVGDSADGVDIVT